MEMATEVVPPLTDLVAALEQATLMAKQLPSTTDPTQLLQIYTSLHSAHRHLSSFLSYSHSHSHSHSHHHPPPLPPANSVSSAVSPIADMDADPMQVGDEDEAEAGEEHQSNATIEKVEERMRDCFIQNKRPKRAISPSAAAAGEQQRRLYEGGFFRELPGFDPLVTRLRSLDLVYQFHG